MVAWLHKAVAPPPTPPPSPPVPPLWPAGEHLPCTPHQGEQGGTRAGAMEPQGGGGANSRHWLVCMAIPGIYLNRFQEFFMARP